MSTLPTPPHKDTYKIRNWKAYNRSLCNRGRLTLWINDSVLNEWEKTSHKQKIVGEQTYCDSIIQCCLLLKINYGLRLRQSNCQLLIVMQGYPNANFANGRESTQITPSVIPNTSSCHSERSEESRRVKGKRFFASL